MALKPADVARPRPAMDEQHHRSRLARHRVARPRQVTDQLQPVARRDDHGLAAAPAARFRAPAGSGTAGRTCAAGAVVVEDSAPARRRLGIADPAGCGRWTRRTSRGRPRPTRGDDRDRPRRSDRSPASAAARRSTGAAIGTQLTGSRTGSPKSASASSASTRNCAARQVLRHHGRAVAALRVEPVERAAVGGDLDHRGGRRHRVRLDAAEQRARSHRRPR